MTDAAAPPAAEPQTPVEAAEAHAVCANCGAALQGAWCHACGQKAHLQSKLRHLVREFAESVASFDGRLWRTLPLLFFRPGVLSRRWREGQRVRHVAPLHFFLFTMFLVFLVPTFTGRHLIQLPSAEEVGADGEGLNLRVGTGTPDTPAAAGRSGPQVRAQSQIRLRTPEERAKARAEAIAQGADPKALEEADAFATRANQRLQRAFKQNEYYSSRIEDLASKLSFVLVPISMAILWLLLLFKRGYSLYDHAVVSLYGVGFLALLIAVGMALPGRAANWAMTGILFAAPVHAVVHLKGAYALSWFGAILRGVFLGVFSSIAFGLFLAGVALAGIFL